jgi:hypothetical protein
MFFCKPEAGNPVFCKKAGISAFFFAEIHTGSLPGSAGEIFLRLRREFAGRFFRETSKPPEHVRKSVLRPPG